MASRTKIPEPNQEPKTEDLSSTTLQTPAQPKTPTYTPLLVLLLIIASFLLGMLVTKVQYLEKGLLPSQNNQPSTGTLSPSPKPSKVDVKVGTLPLLGDKNAKVTIIEFSDLQCPFCRKFFKETYPQIKKEYIDTGKVKLSYRHYPLSFHPMAQKSAEAAECANDQGKFWEFHDVIYEEQEKQGQGTIQYTLDDIKQWAANLGIDSTSFNQCLDSDKYAQKVTDDMNEGTNAGVDGTPAFIINGELIVGAQPFSVFKAAIDKNFK